MKNPNVFKTFGLVILTVFFLSCSAEDGVDGAIGPQGPQGEQGIPGVDGQDGQDGVNGTNGTNGVDGQDGNANVIYSDWIEANWNILDNPRAKTMRIIVTEITNTELRDKTLVYMYLKQYGTSSIYPMPGNGRWSNAFYSFTFGTNSIGLDGILVNVVSTNGVDLTDLQYSAIRGNDFRYVLVPESAQSGKLDYSNYEAVKAFYNLPD